MPENKTEENEIIKTKRIWETVWQGLAGVGGYIGNPPPRSLVIELKQSWVFDGYVQSTAFVNKRPLTWDKNI